MRQATTDQLDEATEETGRTSGQVKLGEGGCSLPPVVPVLPCPKVMLPLGARGVVAN